MRHICFTGSVVGAAVAICALTTSSAAAAIPEFTVLPSVKQYEELVVAGTLKAGPEVVVCQKGTATGEITGMHTVGKVIFKLKECVSASSTRSGCAINSPGAKSGEIVSNTLKGELGSVKPAEATTLVGVLSKPESGKVFTSLEGNECTPATKVTGTIAGEVGPIKQLTNKGFINFETASGKQKIKLILALSGLVEPELVAFSLTATEEKREKLESKEPIEVS